MPEHASATGTSSGAGATDGPRAVLELHVGELRQLFNAMDPAPFRERDLDPKAVAYILDWGREVRAGRALELVVHAGRDPATPGNAAMLREAVHTYFQLRAAATRRQLRQLFRVGRISLLIGIAFLATAILIGEFIAGFISKESYTWIIRESLVIGGWVALWRPIEIFLYDWWPIRAEAKLFDRLGEMDVRVLDAPGLPGTSRA